MLGTVKCQCRYEVINMHSAPLTGNGTFSAIAASRVVPVGVLSDSVNKRGSFGSLRGTDIEGILSYISS
jgi:hypothetical protein